MKYVNVSSPLVYRDSFPFDATAHETLADSMFDMVAEHGVATTVEIGGRSTANLYGIKGHLMPHHHVTCEVFNNWLEQKLIYLRQAWKYENFPMFVSNSWYNEHYRGDWTDEHAHGPCVVCTAYIKKPDNSGNPLVRDPLTEVRTSEPMNIQPWRLIPVNEGDVIFFPGWLRHKTEPSESDERRLTLTFNITPQYELGSY